jgi:hypothetical protein
MILGATTSHKLQLVYGAAAATDLEVSGSVVVVSTASPPVGDGTNTAPFILASLTNTAGATADIVAGIASTKTRITECSVRNKDGSNSVTVTPRRTDGSQTTDGLTVTLLPGEAYCYNGSIWLHFDSNGGLYPSVGNAATQAEMEAGAATNKYVTPQGVNWHPGAAKFWVVFTGNSTTILASWNMTSITDGATGISTVTIATDFSSANWCVQATAEGTASTVAATRLPSCNTIAAGSIIVFTCDAGATPAAQDTVRTHVVGYGDQ